MATEDALVTGRALPISTKASVEICHTVRHMDLQKAKELLDKVIKEKQPIAYKRFNRDLSHKKNIGPGRYPVKTAKMIKMLLESVEANAQFKGLNTSLLTISHIAAHQASRPFRFGRQRRRKAKRTHITIKVEEQKKKEQQPEKKETPTKPKAEKND